MQLYAAMLCGMFFLILVFTVFSSHRKFAYWFSCVSVSTTFRSFSRFQHDFYIPLDGVLLYGIVPWCLWTCFPSGADRFPAKLRLRLSFRSVVWSYAICNRKKSWIRWGKGEKRLWTVDYGEVLCPIECLLFTDLRAEKCWTLHRLQTARNCWTVRQQFVLTTMPFNFSSYWVQHGPWILDAVYMYSRVWFGLHEGAHHWKR